MEQLDYITKNKSNRLIDYINYVACGSVMRCVEDHDGTPKFKFMFKAYANPHDASISIGGYKYSDHFLINYNTQFDRGYNDKIVENILALGTIERVRENEAKLLSLNIGVSKADLEPQLVRFRQFIGEEKRSITPNQAIYKIIYGTGYSCTPNLQAQEYKIRSPENSSKTVDIELEVSFDDESHDCYINIYPSEKLSVEVQSFLSNLSTYLNFNPIHCDYQVLNGTHMYSAVGSFRYKKR